jgi:hypothetical protein
MVDAVLQRVAEARCAYRAVDADALGPLDADPVRREEGGRRMVVAVALRHPKGFRLTFVHSSSLEDFVALFAAARFKIEECLVKARRLL